MARVFVSHARQDRLLATEVFGWLSAQGHELFYDQDLGSGLAVGDHWEQRLFERLRWADAVVCLVTAAYVRSPWCSAEVGIAIARGSRLLPVVGESGVSQPLLKGTTHADYVGDPVAARAALAAALIRLDNAGGRGWAQGRNPFPGLRAFDSDMHGVFFGRRGEVQRLAELLRSPDPADRGVLVITGPSGCGKSSLVRAGLLPEMADEPGWWTLPPIRPGADPVAAVARELTREGRRLGVEWRLPEVRARLESADPAGAFDELLLAVPGEQPQWLLVVIDQLEELVTRTPPSGQLAFTRLLSAMMDASVRVVATVRPEYLTTLLASPNLAGFPMRTFAVRPLEAQALPDVIREPADIAGISIDPELVARLVTDTGSGEALPLLAFTLQRLATDLTWGGRLSLSEYESLGGVQGALTAQADRAVADATAATGRTQEQAVAGLLRLVTVDEQGRPTRTRVPVRDLPDVVQTELASFTARRLLTTDTENDSVVVGVAHEAFLAIWPPLREAIAAAASGLRARRAVEQAATGWDEHDRHQDRLWAGRQLAAALNDLQDPHPPDRPGPDGVALSGTATEFLRVSVRVDRRRRTRIISILSVLLLVAGILAAIALDRGNRLSDQLAAANADTLGSQSLARALDDPVTATQLALTAWQSDPTNPTARSALAHQYMAMRSVDTVFPEIAPGDISSMQRADKPDIVLVRHAGGATALQGLADGRPERWDLPGSAGLSGILLSPDGAVAAGTTADSSVLVWDLANRSGPETLSRGGSTGWQSGLVAGFSADGARLGVITSSDATKSPALYMWDVKRRALIRQPTPLDPSRTVSALWLTDDPGLVLVDDVAAASAPPGDSSRGRLAAVSAADGTLVRDFGDEAMPAESGSSVVTCAEGGSDARAAIVVVASDTGTERRRLPLAAHNGSLCGASSLAVTTDGEHIVTGVGMNTEPYWQLQVTSVDTAATYSIVMPSGRRDSSNSGPLTFGRLDDVVAVDATGGGLTMWIARGTSLLRLTGETQNWTTEIPSAEYTTFESTSDAAYVVAEYQSGISVHDSVSGKVLGQISYADQPTSDYLHTVDVAEYVGRLFRHDGTWMLTQWTLPTMAPGAEYRFPSSPDTGAPSSAAVASDDQRLFALVGNGHQLSAFDSRSHELLGQPVRLGPPLTEVHRPTPPNLSIRAGRADQLVATTTDGKLVVWGIDERRVLSQLPVEINFARESPVFVDPSGERVAVLTTANAIEVWNIDSAQRVAPATPAPRAEAILGFTSDGYVVTRDDGVDSNRIQFWDAENGRPSGELDWPVSVGRLGDEVVDGERLGVRTFDMTPFALAMTGSTWFTALCSATDHDFTEFERNLLPTGTSDEMPCRR